MGESTLRQSAYSFIWPLDILNYLLSCPLKQFQTIDSACPFLWCYTQLVGGTVPKNEWTNRTTSDNLFCKCACSDLSPTLLCSTFYHIYGTNMVRLDTVFYNTEMNIWAGQNFLAAHIVLPKGQHTYPILMNKLWFESYMF